MGKPYESEMRRLSETYEWALNAPIESLTSFVEESLSLPLIAIGSGGSLTAAHLASLLHQEKGRVSKAVTPFEFSHSRKTLLDSSVLILTAKGNNTDILSAFRFAAIAEPRKLMVICMRKRSRISSLSHKFSYVHTLDLELPAGQGGFLATNSLLAFATILIRAYSSFLTNIALPQSFLSTTDWKQKCEDYSRRLAGTSAYAVLHGYWGSPVAIDLESKFTEAALGHVQIADYRNFAHGRHHWLAKHADTAVIALTLPQDKIVAKKTLDLLPRNIPSIELTTELSGPAGTLDLLIQAMHLVGTLGKLRNIDPGRPGVPKFGRDIYHLRTPVSSRLETLSKPQGMDSLGLNTILRKTKCLFLSELHPEELDYWGRAYRVFKKKLGKTLFGAIVFDYDGTLCSADDRYRGLSPEIADQLIRLLRGNLIIGIATGRGKSAKVALRNAIPSDYWGGILVGYYSASDIASLDDDGHPDKSGPMDPKLDAVRNLIASDHYLSTVRNIDYTPKQITIQAQEFSDWLTIKEIANSLAHMKEVQGVQIWESDHSLDILAPSVSKLNIVEDCQAMARKRGNLPSVLCIGDKGRWPGNDFELLTATFSLSVDTVSTSAETCWNLARPGFRGTQALLQYLSCIEVEEGAARYRIH